MKHTIIYELKQLLYPDDIKCIVCGREIIPNRYGLCNQCKIELNENYCLRCGRHKVGVGDYCDECADMSVHFDEARSAVNYVDNAQNLVLRLKFGNSPYLAEYMSRYMLDTLLFTDWDIDCITFVPLHKTRRRKRGYNQAELLAAALAEYTDKPCSALLEKTVVTPTQARSNREERLKNLRGTFSVIGKPPRHLLLIDDVLTTGSTVDECSRVLKKAGAKVVYVLTFASVPERPFLDKPTQNIRDFRR